VCRAGCTLCGNARIDSGEECDDGNRNQDDACLSSCKRARCGDGYLGPGENCDPPGYNDCPLNCKRTLYEECSGSGCNPGEICARVQSNVSYCFKAAQSGCSDAEVKVFNTVCALSCDLSWNDPICCERALVELSAAEPLQHVGRLAGFDAGFMT
jgi:cysteine-rich repeat protein